MRLLRLALLALFPLVAAAPSSAAEKTVSVTGPGCDYKIRFDPAKVDERRLKDTAEILFGQDGLPSPDYSGSGASEPVTPAKVEADRAKCLAPLARAKALTPLDMPGLKELVAGRIEAIEDGCAFQSIQQRALLPGARPDVLLEHKASVADCGVYAKALETPASMRVRFRADVDKQCAGNASPAKCRKEQLAIEEKPNAEELIRRELIGFYWNNCANELTKLSQNQEKDARALETLRKAFRKQFKTKEKCEEG